MEKIFHVVVTSIDVDTKEEKVELDEKYTGFTLVADCAWREGAMAEVVMHDTIADMAAKLAAGEKTRIAVKLAATALIVKEKLGADDAKSALLKAIMGE